jgi:hypothetical protein
MSEGSSGRRPAQSRGRSEPSEDEFQLSRAEPSSVENCDCELEKIFYQAKVDVFTERLKDDAGARAAEEETNRAYLQKFHESMLEVAKGGIDRSRQGADAIRNAAAAVGVIYSGVLGLAFSADHPLPSYGLIAAVFLGLAIVFATAYVARLPRTVENSAVSWPTETGLLTDDFEARTSAFITWVREASIRGRHLLRGAMFALGFGIAFLPAAFISVGGKPIAVEAKPPYPSPPAVDVSASAGQIELEKIAYQAEVTEIAQVRNSQLQAHAVESSFASGIFIVALVALILTLVVGFARDDGEARGIARNGGGDNGGIPFAESAGTRRHGDVGP